MIGASCAGQSQCPASRSARFHQERQLQSARASLLIGGVPAVLIAAFIVKSLRSARSAAGGRGRALHRHALRAPARRESLSAAGLRPSASR